MHFNLCAILSVIKKRQLFLAHASLHHAMSSLPANGSVAILVIKSTIML